MWFNTLKDMNEYFRHQTVTSKQIEEYISVRTQTDWKPFFDQYLRNKDLPVLEYFLVKKDGLNELHYDTHNIFSPLVLSTYHHIIVIGTEPGSTSACPNACISAATGADCGG
jgi:hypothetical protein